MNCLSLIQDQTKLLYNQRISFRKPPSKTSISYAFQKQAVTQLGRVKEILKKKNENNLS